MPKTKEKPTVDEKPAVSQDGEAQVGEKPAVPQDGEAQVGEQAGAETKKDEPTNDLKVIVSLRGGITTVGIQRPGTDPYIESFERHDLADVLEKVVPVVDRAVGRWGDTPVNPAYKRPAGENSSNRRQTSRRRTAQAAPASDGEESSQLQQQTLF